MERTTTETSEYIIPTDTSLIRQGFLLEGQTLGQILKRDEEVLKILGYTAQEVADLLGPICEMACQWNAFHYTASNRKEFNIQVERFRGKQCPWGDRFNLKQFPSSVNLYVTEVGKTEKVRIPGLLRHLIEKHGFFEGGLYRVAPETIVEIFGLERIPGSIEQAKKLLLISPYALTL